MVHVDESDPVGELDLSFPYREVTIKRGVDAKEIYEMVTEVGRGKFGTVYKCKEKSTGLQLAAKFVPIPKREDRRNVEREVEIMNSLQHSLIIQLYDAFEYQKMMCVVLELVQGGELFDRVIDDDFVLTEKACSVFVRQVCQAVEFVHRNNILHLDLKPENILCVTHEGNRIKIIDFGLARKYDPDKKLQILFGTPEFVAPEIVNFDRISFGTDMWSVGVLSYVLVSGLSPFMGSTDVETMANVTIGKYDFDDEAFKTVSKEALDFITKLLVKDISARMTATECLEHIWLKRRTKPQVAIKPVIVPQEKQITPPPLTPPPPPPPPTIQANENEELKTTKDNLKSFIERWEEHPNSPYVFDIGSNQISSINVVDEKRNGGSVLSSRGCSPSPCGSIASDLPQLQDVIPPTQLTETSKPIADPLLPIQNVDELPTTVDVLHVPIDVIDEDPNKKHLKEYLHSFDRRNSDSSCLPNHTTNTSTCEKLNLADEIKKLSERLMMLSSINNDLSEFNEKLTNGGTTKEKTPEPIKIIEKEIVVDKPKSIKIEDSDKLNSVCKKSKLSDRFTRSYSTTNDSESNGISKFSRFTRASSVVSSSSSSSSYNKQMTNGLSERLRSLDETPNLLHRLGNSRNSSNVSISSRNCSSRTLSSSSTTKSSFSNSNSYSNNNIGSAPWPVTNKRTKFRISQLSRDVPIGSPYTHQTVFLEEAVNTTKDCLLHLLEKYNESDTRTAYSNQGRHQSIAVGYGLSDNLEYRSMNSLNHFFQRHASAGNTVKQIQARIESKRKC